MKNTCEKSQFLRAFFLIDFCAKRLSVVVMTVSHQHSWFSRAVVESDASYIGAPPAVFLKPHVVAVVNWGSEKIANRERCGTSFRGEIATRETSWSELPNDTSGAQNHQKTAFWKIFKEKVADASLRINLILQQNEPFRSNSSLFLKYRCFGISMTQKVP